MRTSGRVPELDALRAIAVAGVLASHWLGAYVSGVPIGVFGVRLFFVLSGFLITRILLGAREAIESGRSSVMESLKAFYIRRSLRIFPAYFILVGVSLLIGVQAFYDLLPFILTYTINYVMAVHGSTLFVGHLWSLAVEEQFYWIWPLLVLLCPRRWLLPTIAIVTLLGPISRFAILLLTDGDILVGFLTTSAFDSLGIGALLAIFSFEKRDVPLRTMLVLGILLFGATLLLRSGGDHWLAVRTLQDTGMTLIAGWAIWYSWTNTGSQRLGWLRLLPLLYMGRISYGIYLYHGLLSSIGPLQDVHGPAKAAILVVGTLAIAALSWEAVERPLLRIRA